MKVAKNILHPPDVVFPDANDIGVGVNEVESLLRLDNRILASLESLFSLHWAVCILGIV